MRHISNLSEFGETTEKKTSDQTMNLMLRDDETM